EEKQGGLTMCLISFKILRYFVLVVFVAALALSITPSHQASCELSGDVPLAQTKLPPAASRKVDYRQDIQPLLAQKCYSCHGREVQQAGGLTCVRMPCAVAIMAPS